MRSPKNLLRLLAVALLTTAAAGLEAQTVTTLSSDLLSGLQLRSIGPANMSGRFVDVAVVEKDPYVFYAASATGGVFKTTNNGVTFTPVFENEGTHSVGAIAVHQGNPDIVWVGTGERANRQSNSWGDGVYKSTDGGKTWTNMGLAESHHIGRIVLHPTNPDVVYVAAMGHLWGNNEERGLYKSTDGGTSWKKVLYIDEMTGVVDVAMDPSSPETVYAAAYQRQRKPFGFHGGGPGSGLYKSTDGGATWKELRNGLPEGEYGRIGISIYRKEPKVVYVSVEQGERYTASTTYEKALAGIYRSDDRGESFSHMGTWNPRPMYASQILVDPNDDQRIYMENAFSFSDDGGKTFTVPRQSIHSDDRFLWVDPNDSRHLIKASDGALALSYDRGVTWLFMAHLPVSQYYRVRVDMEIPFNIYGGLQDNGSWKGPSATYRSEGILNEDWTRTGGGDGFLNDIDPDSPYRVYAESQFLGLTLVDTRTNEKKSIRPGNRTGWIESRRNWDVWSTGQEFPLLGEEMSPGNWDGPFLVSPHDPATVYAGTNELWRTTDRGTSWVSLGNLTTGVVRSELTIMGQTPTAATPSLDDGVPFYPTITVIAESPLRKGLLFVGTDDGNLAVSRDSGASFDRVMDRLPGVPRGAWVSAVEPSRFSEDVLYVAVNNYRNDDYENYLYESRDGGRSFRSIVSDLPARRVARMIREDPKTPSLLYLGCELGLFVSIDRGGHWVELKNNLPTLAFNDLLVHPRDNDLVLGTHGRGIWILDNVDSLQELTPELLGEDAHLFTVEPAEMIRYVSVKAQGGDLVFKGKNPPAGAIVDYYTREEIPDGESSLVVLDAEGKEVQSLERTPGRGIHRVVWDLRYPKLPDPVGEEPNDFGEKPKGPKGPWVVPGSYELRLTVRGTSYRQTVAVRDDRRIEVAPDARRAWTATLLDLAAMYRESNETIASLLEPGTDAGAEAARSLKLFRELRRRIVNLYEEVSDWTGEPTEDQRAQVRYLVEARRKLSPAPR
jgi:Sortilin, neurotensin receptor 3,